MAKKKRPSTSGSGGVIARRLFLNLFLPAAGVAGLGFAFHSVKRYVGENVALTEKAPVVVLVNQPAWMSPALAAQITRKVQPREPRSALDDQILRDIAAILELDPWVRQVKQVKRVFRQSAGDCIEIDCEYRAPMALVPFRNELILVDGEGFKLPERFPSGATPPRIMFGPDGRVNIRIIEGVGAMPPYQDGQRWSGEDLQAGLDLVKLLYGKPFAEEIRRVNVSNFKGRKNSREPQLVLVTSHKSEIRWGEPVKANFHSELSPAEKLVRLEQIVHQYGRVDGGHSWLDIRMDKVMHPRGESVVQAGTQRRG